MKLSKKQKQLGDKKISFVKSNKSKVDWREVLVEFAVLEYSLNLLEGMSFQYTRKSKIIISD